MINGKTTFIFFQEKEKKLSYFQETTWAHKGFFNENPQIEKISEIASTKPKQKYPVRETHYTTQKKIAHLSKLVEAKLKPLTTQAHYPNSQNDEESFYRERKKRPGSRKAFAEIFATRQSAFVKPRISVDSHTTALQFLNVNRHHNRFQ